MKALLFLSQKLFLSLIISGLFSCSNFLDIEAPRTDIIAEDVFKNDQSATAAMQGLYSMAYMNNGAVSSSIFSGATITLPSAVSADELEPSSLNIYGGFYSHSLLNDDIVLTNNWQQSYKVIHMANLIIEGVTKSSTISQATKQQLMGEALFMRAFCHFYLVNLFGEVPLIVSTDYRITQLQGKASKAEIFNQIIIDLKGAKEMLVEDYSSIGQERVRVNRWAATAFLARVYLYNKNWNEAEVESSQVITKSDLYFLEPNIHDVFKINSKETILQLRSFAGQGYTYLATQYIPPNTNSIPNFVLTQAQINLFEAEDKRLVNWTRQTMINESVLYHPWKYKNREPLSGLGVEYDVVLRIAEQYLIRSEARAELGKLGEAITDLDVIRLRAGIDLLENTDINANKTEILRKIEIERQQELFTEWGHRWLDLKRTGRADEVLRVNKQNWNASTLFFPIPAVEINNNPLLK